MSVIIKYGLLIILVLTIVFFSQMAYFQKAGENIVSDMTSQASVYLAESSDWAISKVLPQISSKVQSGGASVKDGVDQATEKVSESVTEKISKYFSGIKNSIINPGESQDCQTPAE